MTKMKLGLAAKLSKIEWDMHRLQLSYGEILNTYRQQGKDVGKIVASHTRQKQNIEEILAQVPGAEVLDVIALQKNCTPKAEVEILIALGGDNFFQICSHLFPEAYLVGVNSDPQTSYGKLLYFTPDSLRQRLKQIVKGDFNTEYWARVATTLNGARVEDSTCTVSLSIKATDMMSRYLLKLNGESEEQKCTGILVVSGAGSGTGARYRNAGLYLPQVKSGLYPLVTSEFSRISPKLRTLTREPFMGEECKYKGLNLRVQEGEELTLMYWANDPSELSIDSINRYDVKEGDELKFKVSDKPLKVISKMNRKW
ncbi:hypothetical protein HZC30_05300 [Candidatus Woesearchaeota archaeon]|nr:hypothetical protein [Candidatus Woesearchaeota archaeon]